MQGEGGGPSPPRERAEAGEPTEASPGAAPTAPMVEPDGDTSAASEGAAGLAGPPGREAGGGPAADPVMEALDALGTSLEASAAQEKALGEQVRELQAERMKGLSWREALAKGDGNGVLTLLGRIVVRLTEAGAVLRRALAVALAAEGASTAEIAQRFGVSRQRVFRLLRGKDRT